jgi:hypothetical protein
MAKGQRGKLTLSDRFFIEQNGTMSIADLSQALEQSEDVVQEYCNELVRKNKGKGVGKKARELMDRPAKGVISMSKGASEAGDDSKYNKWVTIEAINHAIADGDMEAARRLREKYDAQKQKSKDIISSKYSDKVHYIIQPDETEESDGSL